VFPETSDVYGWLILFMKSKDSFLEGLKENEELRILTEKFKYW